MVSKWNWFKFPNNVNAYKLDCFFDNQHYLLEKWNGCPPLSEAALHLSTTCLAATEVTVTPKLCVLHYAFWNKQLPVEIERSEWQRKVWGSIKSSQIL